MQSFKQIVGGLFSSLRCQSLWASCFATWPLSRKLQGLRSQHPVLDKAGPASYLEHKARMFRR